MLDIHEANRNLLFFFGAGASVPAGIRDVRGLSDDYSEWLKENSKMEEFESIEQVKTVIEKWLLECQEDRAVDIELILETIVKRPFPAGTSQVLWDTPPLLKAK